MAMAKLTSLAVTLSGIARHTIRHGLKVIEQQAHDGILRRISSRQTLELDRSTVVPPVPRNETTHPARASDSVLS